MGVLEDWGVSTEDLNVILVERPSMRGLLTGFVAEYKLQRTVFSDARIHKLIRYDDHDRTRPADFSFEFHSERVTVEVKSLQTKSIKRGDGELTGRCQVDASDKRLVELPDGSKLETTCLLPDKFDILAVNLYEFTQEWDFGFIRNRDLPRSKYARYTPYQRENLLATSVKVAWPLEFPWYSDPFELLTEIVSERLELRGGVN